MKSDHKICVGMALAMSWLNRNGWRKSDSGIENLFSIQHYIELAQRAEKAKLDFVFRPDTLFLTREHLAHEPGFSSMDPFVLLSAIASHTQKIGLVATASTTFNPPYVTARQLQSLHWASNGRAGWNIVTAIDGQQNFGLARLMPSQQRYQKADEFLQVVGKLWNSYPHQALIFDKERGVFADIDKVNEIKHHGDYFDVQGPLNIPGHNAGRIPLFQAGASEHGRNFAAKVADAVFAATPDIESGIELKQDIAQRAHALGRTRNSVKILPGLSLYLADTKKQARELFSETHACQSKTRQLAYVKETIGIDLSELPDDFPITAEMLPEQKPQVRSQTHTDLLKRLIIRDKPTVKDLLSRPEVIGSAHWLVVGTAEDAYQSIIQRVEAGAADGFIAVPGGSIQSLNLFFDQLMPMLSERGLFRHEYDGNTLLEHLESTNSGQHYV